LTEFENTASFSRNYQAAQDCMCDTEHMFDCSMESSVRALSRDDHRLDQMINKFKVIAYRELQSAYLHKQLNI